MCYRGDRVVCYRGDGVQCVTVVTGCSVLPWGWGAVCYRGDGVQGVLDGQQQDFVSAVGVVRIGRARDALRRGVVEVGLLACTHTHTHTHG